jgi:hypothetical protein
VTGATGPAGAAPRIVTRKKPRKVELITCPSSTTTKARCTTRALHAGPVNAAHAELERNGIVYATGTEKNVHGIPELRLKSTAKIKPGLYTLVLTLHGKTSRRVVTIR